jgi:hypothetical protein
MGYCHIWQCCDMVPVVSFGVYGRTIKHRMFMMTDYQRTKITLIQDINKAKLLLYDKILTVDDFDNLYEMTNFELEHVLYGLDRSIALSRMDFSQLT